MHDLEAPIAVTAASGKTGRRVADLVERAGVPTRRVSRGGPDRFDLDDTSTWVNTLAGAQAPYLAYVPDLAVPGASERIRALSSLAVHQGVERLVLLSGRGEAEAQHRQNIVQDSGARSTVLRARSTGQEIRFEQVPMAAWSAELEQEGVPGDVIGLLGFLFTEVMDGRNESLTHGMHEGLGRAPRSFGDCACRVAATGVWDPR